jgi:hypothetical protein
VMDGAKSFYDYRSRPWLYALQVALFDIIAAAACRALEAEMDDAQPRQPWGRVALAAVLMALPAPLFLAVFRVETGVFSWMLAITVFPFLALWMAVMYFETINPFQALTRTLGLMRWGQGMILGFLVANLSLLLFLFFDFGIWTMVLQFFSWLVPPGEGKMQAFLTIATTAAAALVIHSAFVLTVLGGALQYFSLREASDANALHQNIGRIGQARQIRGLARE